MKLIFLILALCSPLYAQTQPTAEKTLAEINASLASIQIQLDEVIEKKHALERERLALIEKIASDQKKSAYEGGPIIVVRVSGERSIVLLINGREQEVSLSGVMVKMGYSDQAVAFLNRALLVGIVYPKCTDPSCYEVELYSSKDKPSLNCQLAESGIALLVGKKDMGTAQYEKLREEFQVNLIADLELNYSESELAAGNGHQKD